MLAGKGALGRPGPPSVDRARPWCGAPLWGGQPSSVLCGDPQAGSTDTSYESHPLRCGVVCAPPVASSVSAKTTSRPEGATDRPPCSPWLSQALTTDATPASRPQRRLLCPESLSISGVHIRPPSSHKKIAGRGGRLHWAHLGNGHRNTHDCFWEQL